MRSAGLSHGFDAALLRRVRLAGSYDAAPSSGWRDLTESDENRRIAQIAEWLSVSKERRLSFDVRFDSSRRLPVDL
jgi:hypothetical protein